MLVGWQRQVALRNGVRVDSNFSVFYVSVFSDSMSLCLYASVSLCLWEDRCSRDLWFYVGRISGASKVPNSTDISFFPDSQIDSTLHATGIQQ